MLSKPWSSAVALTLAQAAKDGKRERGWGLGVRMNRDWQRRRVHGATGLKTSYFTKRNLLVVYYLGRLIKTLGVQRHLGLFLGCPSIQVPTFLNSYFNIFFGLGVSLDISTLALDPPMCISCISTWMSHDTSIRLWTAWMTIFINVDISKTCLHCSFDSISHYYYFYYQINTAPKLNGVWRTSPS